MRMMKNKQNVSIWGSFSLIYCFVLLGIPMGLFSQAETSIPSPFTPAEERQGQSIGVYPEIDVLIDSPKSRQSADLNLDVPKDFADQKTRRVPLPTKRKYSPLAIQSEDVRLELNEEGNYDLYIRKKPNINSVLLTNYYWGLDEKQVREYGLRSLQPTLVNGREQRIYRGNFIGSQHGLYFLVDSTVEPDPILGQAFRIRVPKYVIYGYQNTQGQLYGVLRIEDGVRINIRAFTRKFSDYRGRYEDNPIRLNLSNRPLQLKNHPVVREILQVTTPEFVQVHVQYQSPDTSFQIFLTREKNESSFQPVKFQNTRPFDRRATLLEAYYQSGVGRIVKAIIYFRRENIPKIYYVTAMDQNQTYALSSLSVQVPAIDAENPNQVGRGARRSSSSFPLTDIPWYEEGNFEE